MEKLTLSVKETVDLTGIGRNKILELIHTDPKFPYIRVGRTYRVNANLLQDYLNQATRMNKAL